MSRAGLASSIFVPAVLVVICPEVSGQEGPEFAGLLQRTDGVSRQFGERTWRAARTIPDNVWRGFQRRGWRVVSSEFVLDVVPQFHNARPRGWPAGTTWNHSDAMLLPDSRLLVLAEKRRSSTGDVVDADRVGGVMRHELGHAFDLLTAGRFAFRSRSPKFVEAYASDVRRLTDLSRRSLAYYLQVAPAGYQETFAEAFALALGGGSDVSLQQDFRAAFPSVLAYVGDMIDRYQP